MNKRYSGIDIIKILAFLLVPSLHFFANYGFMDIKYTSGVVIGEVAVRWISITCIGLFITSTGYLQCTKKPEKRYFLKIFDYILLYGIFCVVTSYIIHGPEGLISHTLYYFTQQPGYFWYMAFFVGLYLLIPYLNMIIDGLVEKGSFEKFLILLVCFISIPEFVNTLPPLIGDTKYLCLPAWWVQFFPIVYYFMGAYFRKKAPVISRFITIPLLIAIPVVMGIVDYVTGDSIKTIGGGYGSIIVVAITFCIFSILYNVDVNAVPVKKVLKYISSLTLGMYLALIVSDYYTSRLMSKWFESLVDGFHFKLYPVEVAVNAGIAFLFAIAADLVVKLLKIIFSIIAGSIHKSR